MIVTGGAVTVVVIGGGGGGKVTVNKGGVTSVDTVIGGG